MNACQELAFSAAELGLACHLLSDQQGAGYITQVLQKFTPNKLSGHLAIHHDSLSIPFEQYELTFPQYLKSEPIYVFFEQSRENKENVFVLEEGQQFGKVMNNTYGYEYFVSNATMAYLLAVNWYVIEGAGSAIEWMKPLQK